MFRELERSSGTCSVFKRPVFYTEVDIVQCWMKLAGIVQCRTTVVGVVQCLQYLLRSGGAREGGILHIGWIICDY